MGRQGANALWMLGAVMMLPLYLACGPIAGYILSKYVLIKFWNLPEILIPIFVGLGILGSGLQTYRLILRIKQFDSQKK